MKEIRKYYNVPAKRGMKVKYDGKAGVIKSSRGSFLRILLDGENVIKTYHPTYLIEYCV